MRKRYNATVPDVTIVDTVSFDDILISIGVSASEIYFVWCSKGNAHPFYSVQRSSTLNNANYLAYSTAEVILKKIIADKNETPVEIEERAINDFVIMDAVHAHGQSYGFGKSESRNAFASLALPLKGQGDIPIVLDASPDFHIAYYKFCSLMRGLLALEH